MLLGSALRFWALVHDTGVPPPCLTPSVSSRHAEGKPKPPTSQRPVEPFLTPPQNGHMHNMCT
ncbi:hypothetical protein SODALDRAFT_335045 [Sodiomyces alkalinus F11]|uniref:Uncharacterized protein n=1 Tax=Sodiomyces alkalinus (strain CBS 110278 / VKM F-3762 / F11) TaxID=1314773 RepID=A0A3N2PR60_SODAK|nr:hypothetical protein SODALDRAFT_335045 [Sodiomyces alkalinus F11]ROT36836.1 hypothetical protein SODALDRAFT_335045 [Sodiomyces alkalinus F11]